MTCDGVGWEDAACVVLYVVLSKLRVYYMFNFVETLGETQWVGLSGSGVP